MPSFITFRLAVLALFWAEVIFLISRFSGSVRCTFPLKYWDLRASADIYRYGICFLRYVSFYKRNLFVLTFTLAFTSALAFTLNVTYLYVYRLRLTLLTFMFTFILTLTFTLEIKTSFYLKVYYYHFLYLTIYLWDYLYLYTYSYLLILTLSLLKISKKSQILLNFNKEEPYVLI